MAVVVDPVDRGSFFISRLRHGRVLLIGGKMVLPVLFIMDMFRLVVPLCLAWTNMEWN